MNGSGSVFGAALEHLPLDELELGSLRGMLVSAVLDVDLTAAAGRLSASLAAPRFSGLAGSSLTANARYSKAKTCGMCAVWQASGCCWSEKVPSATISTAQQAVDHE